MFSPSDDPNAQNNAPRIIVDGQDINQGPPQGKSRRRRSGCGCLGALVVLIIVVATVGGIGVGVLAVINPNVLAKLMTSITGVRALDTQAIVGDATQFDPFAAYAQAKAFAGADVQLLEISANYVRADGTMDLTATYSPAPYTEYKFLHEVPRPADAPPVGAGGTTAGPWYEPISISAYRPGQRRHTSITKGGVRTSFDFINEGLLRDVDDPTSSLSPQFLEAPTCKTADLWKAALEKDAPKDAVAIINYKADGYTFIISGASVVLNFNTDCTLKTR